jgi:hypothetical protein
MYENNNNNNIIIIIIIIIINNDHRFKTLSEFLFYLVADSALQLQQSQTDSLRSPFACSFFQSLLDCFVHSQLSPVLARRQSA